MRPVLAIDTAGPVIGVALWDVDAGSGMARVKRIARGAEEAFPGLVGEVCAAMAVEVRAITGIAVAVGPGTFTGLRVGMAAAGGYAQALNVPIWPASSLLGRAHAVGVVGATLVMLDARKSRVYAALFEGTSVSKTEDIDPVVLLDRMVAPFRATGEGALVYRALIEARGGEVVADADLPGVLSLAELGAAGLARGEGITPTSLAADYAREPDAVAGRAQ